MAPGVAVYLIGTKAQLLPIKSHIGVQTNMNCEIQEVLLFPLMAAMGYNDSTVFLKHVCIKPDPALVEISEKLFGKCHANSAIKIHRVMAESWKTEDFQEELVNLCNQLSPEQLCKLYILMVVDIRLEGSAYEGLNLSIISGKYENDEKDHPRLCAIREMKEELGVDLSEINFQDEEETLCSFCAEWRHGTHMTFIIVLENDFSFQQFHKPLLWPTWYPKDKIKCTVSFIHNNEESEEEEIECNKDDVYEVVEVDQIKTKVRNQDTDIIISITTEDYDNFEIAEKARFSVHPQEHRDKLQNKEQNWRSYGNTPPPRKDYQASWSYRKNRTSTIKQTSPTITFGKRPRFFNSKKKKAATDVKKIAQIAI